MTGGGDFEPSATSARLQSAGRSNLDLITNYSHGRDPKERSIPLLCIVTWYGVPYLVGGSEVLNEKDGIYSAMYYSSTVLYSEYFSLPVLYAPVRDIRLLLKCGFELRTSGTNCHDNRGKEVMSHERFQTTSIF